MTLVVSDTSPLHYLILIGCADLLSRCFSAVIIPTVVAEELGQTATPKVVRDWMAQPPAWLRIQSPKFSESSFGLDKGETQAILLAQELGVRSLLIDERKGFRVAESLGLEPIGLLGILEVCAARGWIDFDEAVTHLRETSFRFHESLIGQIRERLARK